MGLDKYSEQSFEELNAKQEEVVETSIEPADVDVTTTNQCIDCTCGHECGNYNQE